MKQTLAAILLIANSSEKLKATMLPHINSKEGIIDFDRMLANGYLGAENTCAILWARTLWKGFEKQYDPLPLVKAMDIELGLCVLQALAIAWGFTPCPEWMSHDG